MAIDICGLCFPSGPVQASVFLQVLFNINKLQSAQQEEGWFRLGPDKSKHSEYE